MLLQYTKVQLWTKPFYQYKYNMAVEAGSFTKKSYAATFDPTNYFKNTVLVFLNCIKMYMYIAEY